MRLIYARMNASYPSLCNIRIYARLILPRPDNEAFLLACLHEVTEGVIPGRVPFALDRLKGNIKNIFLFVEKSRNKL